jgi:hypothetical protein
VNPGWGESICVQRCGWGTGAKGSTVAARDEAVNVDVAHIKELGTGPVWVAGHSLVAPWPYQRR